MGIFRRGLAKTRQSVFGRLSQMLGNSEIDEDTWDDIEALLIQSDLGMDTTSTVLDYLQEEVRTSGITRTNKLMGLMHNALSALVDDPPELDIQHDLAVILIVGVNGSGKTTSIGKLAHKLKQEGRNVMLAAADTFRAAAIDQLIRWGERINVPVVANKPHSDPGAVVYDALQAAKKQGSDVLIVDTAGRLHNNYNLMQELAKIQRVITKVIPEAPHEVLLVLDGTTGQNALRQGMKFSDVVKITGLIVTKLDGTAKGGLIFSVYNDLNVPVHYIGLGEGIDDLARFDPHAFVDGVLKDPEA